MLKVPRGKMEPTPSIRESLVFLHLVTTHLNCRVQDPSPTPKNYQRVYLSGASFYDYLADPFRPEKVKARTENVENLDNHNHLDDRGRQINNSTHT